MSTQIATPAPAAPSAAPPAPSSAAPPAAGPGGPSGSSPSPAAAPTPSQILDYDPFGPVEPPASATPAAPASPAPGSETPAPAQGTPPPAGARSPTPTDPALAALVEQNSDALRAVADALAQPPAGAQNGRGVPQQDDVPSYEFNVPDQIMAAIGSEVPAERKQGIQVLLQGSHRALHRTVVTQLRQEFMTVMQNYVRGVLEQRQVAHDVRTDYFGKYKEHDVPALHPIIRELAGQLAQERKASRWSPELRDELALRVNAFIAQFRSPVPQMPAPNAPIMPAPGVRPAPVALPSDEQQMLDMLKN